MAPPRGPRHAAARTPRAPDQVTRAALDLARVLRIKDGWRGVGAVAALALLALVVALLLAQTAGALHLPLLGDHGVAPTG